MCMYVYVILCMYSKYSMYDYACMFAIYGTLQIYSICLQYMQLWIYIYNYLSLSPLSPSLSLSLPIS